MEHCTESVAVSWWVRFVHWLRPTRESPAVKAAARRFVDENPLPFDEFQRIYGAVLEQRRPRRAYPCGCILREGEEHYCGPMRQMLVIPRAAWCPHPVEHLNPRTLCCGLCGHPTWVRPL